MKRAATSLIFLVIYVLALYGAVGFFTQKPWRGNQMTVGRKEGKTSNGNQEDTRWSPYTAQTKEQIGSLVKRGLSLIGAEKSTGAQNNEEKKKMETYLISSAALFPSVQEIPIAVSLARRGSKEALDSVIEELRVGNDSLARLAPPPEFRRVHEETIALVQGEIASLEKLRALPLPNEDIFRTFARSEERQALAKRGAAVMKEIKAFIDEYNLKVPADIFGTGS